MPKPAIVTLIGLFALAAISWHRPSQTTERFH
jgi:hypothetical protein